MEDVKSRRLCWDKIPSATDTDSLAESPNFFSKVIPNDNGKRYVLILSCNPSYYENGIVD